MDNDFVRFSDVLAENIDSDNIMQGCKDLESRIIHCIPIDAKRIGFNSVDEAIGTTDYDLLCPAVELAETFIAQDRQVISTKKPLVYIGVHRYANDEMVIHLAQKKVLVDDQGEHIGVFFKAYDLDSDRLKMLLNSNIVSSYVPPNPEADGKQYIFNLISPVVDSLLTPRQHECLYLLLRGRTAKEIARQLNISHRTVLDHIRLIKQRFGCKTKADLFDQAIEYGLINYIPPSMIMEPVDA